MPNTTLQGRGGVLWLVVAILAFLTLALGAWDLLVERDGGEDWLMQAVLPLLLLIFAIVMHRRDRKSLPTTDVPPTDRPR